jgi:hypothetical protein
MGNGNDCDGETTAPATPHNDRNKTALQRFIICEPQNTNGSVAAE